ncbi:hypothetical protein Q9K02_03920 [Qipengyuania sp. G39]|uniref:Uncharacterized protein n=1 Tax=Qipengyuania profundimaris TaxID=3067652 RepID=A0ABT9HMA8_9SPHN|nr:hypothetical protein [Qipengyuania sp. G39]MDP4574283.1 hypothetical protein [Qipengyuania sp. G39]
MPAEFAFVLVFAASVAAFCTWTSRTGILGATLTGMILSFAMSLLIWPAPFWEPILLAELRWDRLLIMAVIVSLAAGLGKRMQIE